METFFLPHLMQTSQPLWALAFVLFQRQLLGASATPVHFEPHTSDVLETRLHSAEARSSWPELGILPQPQGSTLLGWGRWRPLSRASPWLLQRESVRCSHFQFSLSGGTGPTVPDSPSALCSCRALMWHVAAAGTQQARAIGLCLLQREEPLRNCWSHFPLSAWTKLLQAL